MTNFSLGMLEGKSMISFGVILLIGMFNNINLANFLLLEFLRTLLSIYIHILVDFSCY